MLFFLLITFLTIALPVSLAANIGILTVNNLSFGKFAAGSGGSITISANGARTKTGGVFLLPSASGVAANFRVTGVAGKVFSITLPHNDEVKLTSGGHFMAVVNFTMRPASHVFDNNGYQTLSVGGTLNVEPQKQAGDYNGTFYVTLNYE